MGLLKPFQDMKQSVEAAPEMLAQARAHSAQGQQLAAAQPAAAAHQSTRMPTTSPRSASWQNRWASRAERFSAATEGWNERMQTISAVAREFNALYTGRGR